MSDKKSFISLSVVISNLNFGNLLNALLSTLLAARVFVKVASNLGPSTDTISIRRGTSLGSDKYNLNTPYYAIYIWTKRFLNSIINWFRLRAMNEYD